MLSCLTFSNTYQGWSLLLFSVRQWTRRVRLWITECHRLMVWRSCCGSKRRRRSKSMYACMYVCISILQTHCKSFLIHTFYLLLDLIVDRLIPCTFPSAVHNETLQSSCGSLHIHTKVDCSTSSCFQKYPVQADVLHREIKLLDREEKKSKISSRHHTYSSLDT